MPVPWLSQQIELPYILMVLLRHFVVCVIYRWNFTPPLMIGHETSPSGSEAVHVSKALQKAKIEVNEDGTKAAAATGGYCVTVE